MEQLVHKVGQELQGHQVHLDLPDHSDLQVLLVDLELLVLQVYKVHQVHREPVYQDQVVSDQ